MQTGAVVPNKQPKNTAANSPTPKLTPVGAGKAVPAFPSPSAKGIVSIGKGAPPAAGSSQVIYIVLQLPLCDALHGGECKAQSVHWLVSVLYQCAGHGGGLASAHAYCAPHVPVLTYT